MQLDALATAKQWVDVLYNGDFKGRHGLEEILAFLIQREAWSEDDKMTATYPSMSIRVPIHGKGRRVFALHRKLSGVMEFSVTFRDFHRRVPETTLHEMDKILRVPGMINAMSHVREKQFHAMARAQIDDVLHDEKRVRALIDALRLLLESEWTK
jgi:hypothetical protein